MHPPTPQWPRRDFHLDPNTVVFEPLVSASPAGFARWQFPVVPVTPALLGTVTGLQAWIGNGTLTNAIRITVGGGL